MYEQTIKSYLFGELSESEQSAFEEKFFTDPQVLNQLLKTENELVDGYVRGQLSKELREQIEQSYMVHPARAKRIAFANALATRLDQIEEVATNRAGPALRGSWWQSLAAFWHDRQPAMRLSAALAMLLIVIGGVWFSIESRRRQRELAQIQADQAHQEQLAREQDAERQRLAQMPPQPIHSPNEGERLARNPQPSPQPSQSPAPPVVFLTLSVGGVRGADGSGTQTLVIQRGTTQAQLLVKLTKNSYPRYRASLQMVGGAEIFSQTNVQPRSTKSGTSFVFTVSARKLASGDYTLTLSGINSNGEVDDLSKSLFRVEKK